MDLTSKQLNKIQEIQLKSIQENKENGFLICDTDIHEINQQLSTNKKESHIDFSLNDVKSIIQTKCKNKNNIMLGHTHATGSYNPSNIDFKTNDQILFLDGFCSVGIDNVSCFDKNNEKIYTHNNRDKIFDKKFKDVGQIFEGDNLICDKKEKEYRCNLNDTHQSKFIGSYNNVGTSGLVNYSQDKKIIASGFDGKKMKCYADYKKNLFCLNDVTNVNVINKNT